MNTFRFTLAAAVLACTSADMYMHNPRGSNNRLDEARRDRANGNRVFDSQNNNRGGSNVGSLYYFDGEKIPMEWTNQHGCGMSNNDCQIVIQYMCSDKLRDGVTTRTIPDQPSNCLNNDCNNDVRYGMHETYDYYMNCKYRHRNKGLFTADRNLNGQTARFTRQNNNGQRRGYECPEERDHFPYWHPTPWIDLAVMTNEPSKCEMYKAKSENVLGRNFCSLPDDWYHHMVGRGGNGNNGFIPNNEIDCQKLNNPGTQMTNFLKSEKAAEHAALAATAAAQQQTCNEFLADFTNELTASGKPVADFCKEVTMSPEDLDDQCPECGADHILHPHFKDVPGDDEPCHVCVPTECDVTQYATIVNETICAEGMKQDLFNPQWCVTEKCFNKTNTHADQLAVDSCRLDATTRKHLVSNCENAATRTCELRAIMESECFASELEQSFWALSTPHQEKNSKIQELQCLQAAWSRPNQLGNGMDTDGQTNGWNLTYPEGLTGKCAMRMRYNITTTDYNGLDPHDSAQVNSTQNKRNGNGGNIAKITINAAHNIQTMDSREPWRNMRGYHFKQNPEVQIFDNYQYQFHPCPEGAAVEDDVTMCFKVTNGEVTEEKVLANAGKAASFCYIGTKLNAAGKCEDAQGTVTDPSATDKDFHLRLAINTNQFGRTFQDRSHSYISKERDVELASKCNNIYALNVRGKRGNVVQTFPGTEYDFTPNRLHVAEGDCVHFQWTGSNTNPNNNDGQGKQGTDRSNVAVSETIRGEGGRGVERAGGKGANGFTWTTDKQEPGLLGFEVNQEATMADYPCIAPNSQPHPADWKKCSDPTCTWVVRTHTTKVGEDGEPEQVWEDCETGFKVDVVDNHKCVNAACPPFTDRTMNSEMWTGATRRLQELIGTAGEGMLHGHWGGSHPDHLDNVTRDGFLGMNRTVLEFLATLNNHQLGGEMSELDDSATYYDLGVQKVSGVGTWSYLCTRNNNFSNRSQKGKIKVSKAPESGKLIDQNGGAIGMMVDEAFRGVATNEDQMVAMSDFAIVIPPKSLNALFNVQAKVFTSEEGVGMSSAASEVMWVGPQNLASQPVFNTINLGFVGDSRKRAADQLVDLQAKIAVYNSTTVAFKITATNMAKETCVSPQVQFETEANGLETTIKNLTVGFNKDIIGLWLDMTPQLVVAAERGELWMSLWCESDQYKAQASKDDESGKPIIIRMPVSVTADYGKVYYWPDTETGKKCVLSAGDKSGCNHIRSSVDDVQFSGSTAQFEVGKSATAPAGGFYQVGAGNDLPIIVGVTVACLLIALVAVGSAVYFRKHPAKWEEFKGYGPKKIKDVKRSWASAV